jgi:hypothetical protein
MKLVLADFNILLYLLDFFIDLIIIKAQVHSTTEFLSVVLIDAIERLH